MTVSRMNLKLYYDIRQNSWTNVLFGVNVVEGILQRVILMYVFLDAVVEPFQLVSVQKFRSKKDWIIVNSLNL